MAVELSRPVDIAAPGAGRAASSDVYNSQPAAGKVNEYQLVLDVALELLRTGMPDVTRYEIQQAFNVRHSPARSDGWISARVSMLLKQNRLVETGNSRPNPISGKPNSTLMAPVRQGRLVA